MPKLKITLYFEQSNFSIQLLDCKLSRKAGQNGLPEKKKFIVSDVLATYTDFRFI
jgi:hypothetical protein